MVNEPALGWVAGDDEGGLEAQPSPGRLHPPLGCRRPRAQVASCL